MSLSLPRSELEPADGLFFPGVKRLQAERGYLPLSAASMDCYCLLGGRSRLFGSGDGGLEGLAKKTVPDLRTITLSDIHIRST